MDRLILLGFLAAVALGIAALALPWWQFAASQGGHTDTWLFPLGGSYSINCMGASCGGFTSGANPYSALGGAIAPLYDLVAGVAIIAVILSGLAALLVAFAVFGRRDGAVFYSRWVPRFGLLAAILLIGITATLAVVQPAAFGSGDSFVGTTAGGSSPATSFWGAGPSSLWGPSAGWYCGLVGGGAVALFTFIVRPLARSAPATGRPRRARAVVPSRGRATLTPPVYAPTIRTSASSSSNGNGYTAPPSPNPAARAPVPVPVVKTQTSASVACPSCGFQNSARAKICSYCQRPMHEASVPVAPSSTGG
ncbi:MAG TPA: zinc finger Ran-binding domain-containing protein [Thermoplasmata archaeon]|nr:zinc finger Ran-binding domain-containing protein [Thermoplasmata archaeon]